MDSAARSSWKRPVGGVEVEVINRDIIDDGSDLLESEPFASDLAMARCGGIDGYHAGFRCSSFSRVRFRPGGPPPVRDRSHPQGFPSNSKPQQLEAERGNLMATRSVVMARATHLGGRNVGKLSTATLENPADPGVAPFPSAWLLPAVRAFAEEPFVEKAVHNVCCFGPPHWKEQCWLGILPGLSALARKCRCTTPHVPLVGKAATAAAAAYPPQLCEEYAAIWLDAVTAPTLGNRSDRVLPSSASILLGATGSKKELKEAENLEHLGGLRRPAETLYLAPGWEATGRRLWRCIDDALEADPAAEALTANYGQADYEGPPERLVERVREALKQEFGLQPVDVPKPSLGTPTTMRPDILCGILRIAGDPDADILQDWLVNGAPLGMDRQIEVSGVFPPAAAPDREDDSPPPDVLEQIAAGFEHYKSVADNLEEATLEFDRYRQAGIAVDVDDRLLAERFKAGHVNKLGLIIKESHGKRKVRIIVDMRRSRANARAAVPERPVLPRPLDAVQDWLALFTEAHQRGLAEPRGETIASEGITCDFADAYCHVAVHDAELKNCLVAQPAVSGTPAKRQPIQQACASLLQKSSPKTG